MALTVELTNNEGDLVIRDDEIGNVGTGKARPSKSFPGYVTLVLDLRKRAELNLKSGKVTSEFLVIRVPMNWLDIP